MAENPQATQSGSTPLSAAAQDMAVLTTILNRRQHLSERFSQLVEEWRQQRNPYSSDPASPASCPAYLKIIALGAEAIPLILEEMRARPDHWFIALESLTDADPVAAKHYGDFSGMVDDWLQWGVEHGFLPR